MIIRFPIVAFLIAIQVGPAHAITVHEGETVRASYALTGSDLQPESYLLQFTGDILDPGDVFSVSLFNSDLNLLGLTQFSLDASQTTGRLSIFLNIDRNDFAPSVGPLDPVRIPSAGFIEFASQNGSFGLSAITVTATDRAVFPFPLSQDMLVNFTPVVTPSPAPVPLPSPALSLLSALMGLAALVRCPGLLRRTTA